MAEYYHHVGKVVNLFFDFKKIDAVAYTLFLFQHVETIVSVCIFSVGSGMIDRHKKEYRYKELRFMNIRMSTDAARWYIRELNLTKGDAVRFFPRYSSGGGLHPGFSLGISVEQPIKDMLFQDVEGIHFFLEEHDLWYLRGYDLVVNYVESQDDIDYVYEELHV